MKKAEFREWVKEMFIDLVYNDDEVRDVVLEFVKENSSLLIESSQDIPKEPVDPELYDTLLLVASGKTKKVSHNGHTIKTPNYGTGFKSGKMIKEWANKAYSKLGGQWQKAYDNTRANDMLSFLSAMDGGSGNDLRTLAGTGNEHILKENIVKSGRGQMMALTEDGQFDPNNSVDISGILADTAKTTLQSFPTAHDSEGGTTGVGAQSEAFSGTPEQAFGSSANMWAHLAFNGMDTGSE